MKAAQGLLLLLLGLLTLPAELLPSMGQLGKPGVCPTPSPYVTTFCISKCSSDWECPGEQKCCQYACLQDCMEPT